MKMQRIKTITFTLALAAIMLFTCTFAVVMAEDDQS